MNDAASGRWECDVCGYLYDETEEGVRWEDLPDDWECPNCGASKSQFVPVSAAPASADNAEEPKVGYLADWARPSDDLEYHMAEIHRMAETGESLAEPMGARRARISWDDILVKGAQLARLPLNPDEPVNSQTTIGPDADRPMVIGEPRG